MPLEGKRPFIDCGGWYLVGRQRAGPFGAMARVGWPATNRLAPRYIFDSFSFRVIQRFPRLRVRAIRSWSARSAVPPAHRNCQPLPLPVSTIRHMQQATGLRLDGLAAAIVALGGRDVAVAGQLLHGR